jgi:hypothetical protein
MTKRQGKLLLKWIEALESGDYKRGQGRLVRSLESGPDEFCCLGVLCDVKSGLKRIKRNGESGYENTKTGEKLFYTTHNDIFDWTGIDLDKKFGVSKQDAEAYLCEKNDDGGWSFNRTAKWLRQFLPDEAVA